MKAETILPHRMSINPLLARIIDATGMSFLLSDEMLAEHNDVTIDLLKRQAECVRSIRSMEPFCNIPRFASTVATIVEERSRCTSCDSDTHLLISIQPSENESRTQPHRICYCCWYKALLQLFEMLPGEVSQ